MSGFGTNEPCQHSTQFSQEFEAMGCKTLSACRLHWTLVSAASFGSSQG